MNADEAKALRAKGVLVSSGYGAVMFGLRDCVKVPVVSLDIGSVVPTDQEVALVRAYAEFCALKIYDPHHVPAILREGVEGHNSMILSKGPSWASCGPEGWCFRRATWTQGPTFIPWHGSKPAPPWGLVQVLDFEERMFPERWAAWKKVHAELVAPLCART